MKLLRPYLFISLSMSSFYSEAQADRSYSDLLVNRHTNFQICGKLPYKRVRRDCLSTKLGDFKSCIESEKRNPLYQSSKSEELNYLCINSKTTRGVEIIEEYLKATHSLCLHERISDIRNKILSKSKFQELFQDYQKYLEHEIKLNFAIDIDNHTSSLGLYLEDLKAQRHLKNFMNIGYNWSHSFKNKKNCKGPDPKKIFSIAAQELQVLQLRKIASEGFDPLNGEGRREINIRNDARFKKGRIPASRQK